MRYKTLLLAALLIGCGTTDDATDPQAGPSPPRFIVGPVPASVTVGDSLQMFATFENVAPVAVIWMSSDTTLATVSTTGIVRGLKSGSATVTAAAPAYGFATPVVVTVR